MSTDCSSLAPIIWRQKEGQDRSPLNRVRLAAELQMDDPQMQARSFMGVIEWMQDSKQLDENYHVTESSCQDFARNLFVEAVRLPYPNPAKYKTIFPFREYASTSFFVTWS